MTRLITRTSGLILVALMASGLPAAAAPLPADAPSTDELLERMIDALGGRAVVETTTTVRQRGIISIPQIGLSGTMELRWQAPDYYVAHTDLPGIGRTSQGHDGTVVWRRSPGQATTTLSGFEAEQTLAFADFRGPLTYRDRFASLTVTGFGPYEGHNCWTLTLRANDRYVIHQFVDAETYLIRGIEQLLTANIEPNTLPTRITSVYEDYKEVEGRMLLVTWRVMAGGQEQRFDLSEVSLSRHPDGTFDRPRTDEEATEDEKAEAEAEAPVEAVRELTELEACVLGVVENEGPCTAYTVRARFATSPTKRWSGSAGAIYPLVRRLGAAGLLSETTRPRGSRSSSHHAVTDAGRAALRQWLTQPADDEVVSIPVDPVRTRLFFLETLSPAQRRDWVRRVDRRLAAQAEALRREWQEDDFRSEIERLAARGTLEMVEARLRWFASVRARYEPS